MMESVDTQRPIARRRDVTNEQLLPVLGEPGNGQGSDLVSQLLHEQSQLTAVEQFARAQHNGRPSQEKYYSKLLPATPPEEGQQYAFEVDLDRCSGCKACVTACHSLNGLDEYETWRDVGLLIGGTASKPVMQHVTTACHHCLEPGCMAACPVDAYEKDPVTGIVKHLDDQCFGCQYCTLACPYDVPKYHAGKGIVRKCDMCSERLADGEAPACVQACPHEAIAIRLVDRQEVIDDAEAGHFLPAAPDPQITLPTTTYKTSRVFPRNTLPADYHAVNPQHPHWPLIVMLVLTQLSVGAFIVGLLLESTLPVAVAESFRRLHATNALGFGLLALGASTLHLGRPQYAYRAFIGLRHSWLSREIVAFGLFAGVACLYAAASWLMPSRLFVPVLGWLTAALGGIGVVCSVMIYVFTGREFWSLAITACKFAMTSAILGIAAAWLSLLLLDAVFPTPSPAVLSDATAARLLQGLVLVGVAKLLLEGSLFLQLLNRRESPLKRSARLLIGPLAGSLFARIACGVLGSVVMPLFLWNELTAADSPAVFRIISVAMMFAACLAGELLERYQFFSACAAPRMPGRLNP